MEIVGEATKRFSPELRARHPEIEWKRATGMRDFVIHNYMGVDLLKVWETARDDTPKLKRQIEAILEAEVGSPE